VKKGDFIFVYGTLRRGERADLSKQSHNFGVKFCSIDRINGRMYHLGAYPGVKPLTPPEIAQTSGGEFHDKLPTISGEVFLVLNASVVAIMDAYEGYDSDEPARGLYDRHEVEAESGKTVWVYTYNPMVTADQLIESGDWCKNPDMPIRTKVLRQ
jgi:gamma-glutamylcyclotransferase (GGCT)/AIG2-like uncharacterized protein YtfP